MEPSGTTISVRLIAYLDNGTLILIPFLGDPTVFGNLHPPRALLDAVKKSLETSSAGYAHSAGLEVTRRAVAEFCSTKDHQLTEHVRMYTRLRTMCA